MVEILQRVTGALERSHIDWILLGSILFIAGAGLVTMNSFYGENYFFFRQLIWIGVGLLLFFILSFIDFRFLKRTWIIVTLFTASIVTLLSVLIFGDIFLGAQRWFDLGFFVLQPSDPIKLIVLLLLAKYFSRRHVEIAHVRHILVSGAYVVAIAALIFLQPDFGSAIIIIALWLGVILVAGISQNILRLCLF